MPRLAFSRHAQCGTADKAQTQMVTQLSDFDRSYAFAGAMTPSHPVESYAPVLYILWLSHMHAPTHNA